MMIAIPIWTLTTIDEEKNSLETKRQLEREQRIAKPKRPKVQAPNVPAGEETLVDLTESNTKKNDTMGKVATDMHFKLTSTLTTASAPDLSDFVSKHLLSKGQVLGDAIQD